MPAAGRVYTSLCMLTNCCHNHSCPDLNIDMCICITCMCRCMLQNQVEAWLHQLVRAGGARCHPCKQVHGTLTCIDTGGTTMGMAWLHALYGHVLRSEKGGLAGCHATLCLQAEVLQSDHQSGLGTCQPCNNIEVTKCSPNPIVTMWESHISDGYDALQPNPNYHTMSLNERHASRHPTPHQVTPNTNLQAATSYNETQLT